MPAHEEEIRPTPISPGAQGLEASVSASFQVLYVLIESLTGLDPIMDARLRQGLDRAIVALQIYADDDPGNNEKAQAVLMVQYLKADLFRGGQ